MLFLQKINNKKKNIMLNFYRNIIIEEYQKYIYIIYSNNIYLNNSLILKKNIEYFVFYLS